MINLVQVMRQWLPLSDNAKKRMWKEKQYLSIISGNVSARYGHAVSRCLSICAHVQNCKTNSGWVERADSVLDHACQKKRNRVNVDNLKEIFFLTLLKLEQKNCLNYTKEIGVGNNNEELTRIFL